MVQLSDDSVHGKMLRVEDAIEHLGQLLTATCAQRADEHILPIDADNRVIAQDITARSMYLPMRIQRSMGTPSPMPRWTRPARRPH